MTSFVRKVTSHRHCHAIYTIILIFSLTSCIIVTQWQTIALLIRWRPPECTDTTLYLIQREQILSNIADQAIVNPPGSFLHRVEQYNDALSRMRTRILSNGNGSDWPKKEPRVRCAISERRKGYFLEQITKVGVATRVVLGWWEDDVSSNILLTEYYSWSASEPLCTWIRTPGALKPHIHDIIFNYTCNTNREEGLQAHEIEPITLNWRPITKGIYWPTPEGHFPRNFYYDYPKHTFYIHIFRDAYVAADGDVISDDLLIQPSTCGYMNRVTADTTSGVPLYAEVFVVSQYWGGEYFHRLIETLPRLAPYLRFLRNHPNVKIQVPKVDPLMKKVMDIMGLSRNVLVTGSVRGHVVYLPQGTPCGTALVQQTQLMSACPVEIVHPTNCRVTKLCTPLTILVSQRCAKFLPSPLSYIFMQTEVCKRTKLVGGRNSSTKIFAGR